MTQDYGYWQVDKGLRAKIKLAPYINVVEYWKFRLLDQSVFFNLTLNVKDEVRWYKDGVGHKWPRAVHKTALLRDYLEWGKPEPTVDDSSFWQTLKPFIFSKNYQGVDTKMMRQVPDSRVPVFRRYPFLKLPSWVACAYQFEVMTGEPVTGDGQPLFRDPVMGKLFDVGEAAAFTIRQNTGFFKIEGYCDGYHKGIRKAAPEAQGREEVR